MVAPTGRFLAVNRAFCQLLDRDAPTLLATSIADVTHAEDLAVSRTLTDRAVSGEIDTCQQPKRFLLPNGGIVWGLLTVSIVRDGEGVPLQYVAQAQDITDRKTSEGELRRYAARLETLSEQDPLTGLPNRRAFHVAVEEEVRVFALGGSPAACCSPRSTGTTPRSLPRQTCWLVPAEALTWWPISVMESSRCFFPAWT